MAYSLAQTKPEETEPCKSWRLSVRWLYGQRQAVKDAQSQLKEASSGSIEQAMDNAPPAMRRCCA
jgi:hypothetical protein